MEARRARGEKNYSSLFKEAIIEGASVCVSISIVGGPIVFLFAPCVFSLAKTPLSLSIYSATEKEEKVGGRGCLK